MASKIGQTSSRILRSNLVVATLVSALVVHSALPSSDESSVSVTQGSLAELVPAYVHGSAAIFGSRGSAAGIYETSGWYPRESDFVWSRGERQQIVIIVAPELAGAACELELVLEAGGFVPDPSAGLRQLRVSAAGSVSARELDSGRTTHRHAMTFRSLPEAIAVEAAVDALSPRRFGSTDGRSLGWRLYSASIVGLKNCEGQSGD